MKGRDYMAKMEINARGLSSQEIQTAIDSYVETKKPGYLPQLEAELQKIAEQRKVLEMQLGVDFEPVK